MSLDLRVMRSSTLTKVVVQAGRHHLEDSAPSNSRVTSPINAMPPRLDLSTDDGAFLIVKEWGLNQKAGHPGLVICNQQSEQASEELERLSHAISWATLWTQIIFLQPVLALELVHCYPTLIFGMLLEKHQCLTTSHSLTMQHEIGMIGKHVCKLKLTHYGGEESGINTIKPLHFVILDMKHDAKQMLLAEDIILLVE